MKEFYTESEKKMITNLVSCMNTRVFFSEFIANNMEAIAIELLKNDSFAIVTKEHLDPKEYSQAEKSVIEIICLLKYLLKENLITLFFYDKKNVNSTKKTIRIYNKEKYKYNDKTTDGQEGEALDLDGLIKSLRSGRYSSTICKDGRDLEFFFAESMIQSQGSISDFIKENFSSFIYPSSLLIELVKNKFKTPEQIRFKKQYICTWVSIIIAIAIGLAGLRDKLPLQKNDSLNSIQTIDINSTTQSNKEIHPETKNSNSIIDVIKDSNLTK